MKKLMIAAAVAAITTGASAAQCALTPDSGCVVQFQVKFSGKTATQVLTKKGEDKGYASVQKLSGKGTLTLDEIGYYEEFTEVKVGSYKVTDDYEIILEDGDILQWTYFGKDLENVDGNGPKSKPGKSFSLESDFGIQFEDATDDFAVSVQQVAFGKAKAKLSKEGKKNEGCVVVPIEGCIPSIEIKDYKGWFTGWFEPTCADVEATVYGCVPFVDNGIALIGGTWSAKVKKQ